MARIKVVRSVNNNTVIIIIMRITVNSERFRSCLKIVLHICWRLNMPCLSSLWSAVSRSLVYTLFSFLVFLLCSFSLLNYHCSITPINMRHLRHNQIWQCCTLRRIFHRGMVDNTNKYGSAVIYTVYFTVAWLTIQINRESKYYNLHRLFHRGMVDDTNKYGSSGEFSGFFCSCLHMVDDTKVTWATC